MSGEDSSARGSNDASGDAEVSGPVQRIAHLSDVHFGKIAHPAVVDALVEEVNAEGFDLVVVSGDLTQRATRQQFRDARAMLDRFSAPTLVVPGNHDVRAWWHQPFERVFDSARRFRHFITSDVTPAFTARGLAVFGLDSAHGMTIKGGKIRPRHLEEMAAFFASRAADDFRILVLHHHLLRLEELGGHDVARGARRALALAEASGVDLILCGHLHRSHVARVELAPKLAGVAGHRLVVASAGTATSSRGRAENAGTNVYNWIEVGAERFAIQERRFEPVTGTFAHDRETSFART